MMGIDEHKKHAPKKISMAVLSVSSTRHLKNDKSGLWIKDQAEREGHTVVLHRVIGDDQVGISKAVFEAVQNPECQAILITGGTGITCSDVTIEAVRPLFSKELTGFSALFTMLSYNEIGSAAILSRAVAGLISNTPVFCMPGSFNACQTACKSIIFPEIGHIVKHALDR